MSHQAVSAMRICPLCSLQAWHEVGPHQMDDGAQSHCQGKKQRRGRPDGTALSSQQNHRRREQWAGKRGQEDGVEGVVAPEASADDTCALRPTSHFAPAEARLVSASSILPLKLNRDFYFPGCSVRGVLGMLKKTR